MDKKSKRDVIVVTIFSFSVVLWISLAFVGNVRIGQFVTMETYISVIATMIGVCAAIMVGFQIAHYIEFKELEQKIRQIDELRKDIEQKADELQRNLSFVKRGLSTSFRIYYRRYLNDPLAPVACINAIITYEITDSVQASTTLLGHYRKLQKILNNPHCNTRLARRYVNDLAQNGYTR